MFAMEVINGIYAVVGLHELNTRHAYRTRYAFRDDEGDDGMRVLAQARGFLDPGKQVSSSNL